MPQFAYTGGVQTYTIPYTGIYHLMVVGGNGAHRDMDSHKPPPYGGCAVGYREFKKGTKLYICCGQAGRFDGNAAYNGGGSAPMPSDKTNSGGGGAGATHIALMSGTLAEIGVSNKSQVLIVAGGSGGCSYGPGFDDAYSRKGGYGGGESGGYGDNYGGVGSKAVPGTQSSGYAFGQGESTTVCPDFYGLKLCAGGGGGGYYGGYAGQSQGCSGAGGSGYIGGVPANLTYKGTTYKAAMSSNFNSAGTNGYAQIDLVVKTTIPVTFNGTTLEAITFNGTEIESLIYNGTTLY